MVIHVTCKNEEDPIKNEGAMVFTTLYTDFFRRSKIAYSYSVVLRSQWLSLAKIRTHPSFMHAHVTCKNEENPIKNGGTGQGCSQHISHF